MAFFLERIETMGEKGGGWYVWYAVRTDVAPRALVGSGGYMGPPDSEGTVEIGYSVLPEFRGQGFAGEIVQALVARAFSFPRVERVIAHTVTSNAASIAVLTKCGFRFAEATEGEGVRYERRKAA
jgi:RimJ/RimL family protein N-acetyltransferase